MTKAHFTIEVDLPDGVTHEDFRFWAEHELRCAVGGTAPDDPLRKLKRDKIIVRTTPTSALIAELLRDMPTFFANPPAKTTEAVCNEIRRRAGLEGEG